MQRKHSQYVSGNGTREWLLPDRLQIKGLAFWEWDLETDYVLFSQEWENILQSRDYDQARPGDPTWWRQRIHPDDVQGMIQAAEDIVQGLTTDYNVLFRLQRVDGCWAWLLSRASVSAMRDGRATWVSGVLFDISALRTDSKFQMAEAVGNATYHAMLENSPDMYVRMDRELFPVYMNPVVARYMGREREQFSYFESLEELKIEPAQLAFLHKNVGRIFDEKVALREMVTFADANGQDITGEYSFWPEFDNQGQVIYAMTQFRDLSHQARAEEQARIHSQRLDALNRLTLMDNASEAEVLNFVMNRLLELTRSESGFIFIPRGESPYEGEMLWSGDHYLWLDRCYLPNDTLPEDLIALMKDENGKIIFRSMRNGDGKTPIQVSFDGQMPVMRSMIAPAMDGARVACIAGVCNKAKNYDEADLLQLETFINGAWLVIHRQRFLRELRRAKEAAEHANKIKDIFLANVSHELRTPLNGMLSMLQLLELLPMTEQQREYVYAANDSGKALLRIISDILDFSHMESGRMQLQKEPFNLKESVCSTMRLFSSEAIKKGLKVGFSMDDAIPERLLGDEARVRQILFNLVGNALKFTEKGQVRVDCALLPEEEGNDNSLRLQITVEDTGIGIPPEKRDVIFEAFTQLDNSPTRRYAGTGLGLGIVRQLVAMMDGDISMDSEVGRGTTVCCVLRLERCAAAPQSLEARLEQTEGPGLDILVAEDDAVGRFAIRSFLQRAGHRPFCVDDGRQALQALQLRHFDCLFTDIQMPVLDGLEVVRRVRTGDFEGMEPSDAVRDMLAAGPGFDDADAGGRTVKVNPDLIIVVVSAHAMRGDRERFLQQGVNHYISKPIRLEELGAVLAKIGASLRNH